MSNSGSEARYGHDTCPRCGAREILPDAQLRRHGEMANTMRLLVHGAPDAWLFKKRKSSKIRASVCTACSHIDFYAEDPDTLREAYQQRNAPD